MTPQEKYAKLMAQGEALVKANPDGLTPEQSKEFDGYMGEADQIKTHIERGEMLKKGKEFSETPVMLHGHRKAGQDEGDVPVDPKAWREVKVKTHVGERTYRYHVPLGVQSKDYSNAFEAYLRKGYYDSLGANDQKTLSSGVDSAGGFLVPEDWQEKLIVKTATQAVVRSLANVIQVSSDVAVFPRVIYDTDDKYTSGVRITYTGEEPATDTEHRVTDPVYGQIKIPVHTAMASLPITNNLIEDNAFDVEGHTSRLLAEAFSLGEDTAFINGDGIAKPMGILAQVDVASKGPSSVISGHATLYTGAGLVNLYFECPSQYRNNAKWLMNSVSMKGIENLVDGQNRYLVQSLINGSLASGQFEMLKGKQVLIDEFVPDPAAGTYAAIFGDFSGYTIVDRVGFSIQVLKEKYAEKNLQVMLARKRFGGQLTEPYRMKVQKISA